LRLERCDSGAVLDAALETLRAAIAEEGAEVTRDPLPVVRADPRMLESVFQNLVGNALRFRGERAPLVHVGARAARNAWVFSVRDNGIGIAPEYAGVIFEMFQRLERRPGDRSTGVGLAICRRAVERHGGRIWVQSAAGQGSTFCFTLPASDGSGDGAAA
jgi:light-regulated signal transduction histidine kinase (bacteriophytochrome)